MLKDISAKVDCHSLEPLESVLLLIKNALPNLGNYEGLTKDFKNGT